MKPKVSVITSCYRGYDYLEGYFNNILQQTLFDKIEVIFLHNQPDEKEKKIINKFVDDYPDVIRYFETNPVESLGASWNMGWQLSCGEYITIWNVDDRRAPNSIYVLAQTLDQEKDCILAYGDYLIVNEYGKERGKRINTPRFSKRYFSRSFPQGGAFYLWRKNLINSVGPFDEQLKVVMDFDLSLRISNMGFCMCRVDSILGYFTDIGKGLSTIDSASQTSIERNFLYLRYGIYDKMRYQYRSKITNLKVEELLYNGDWISISSFWGSFSKVRKLRSYLWAGYLIRNVLRFIFKKTGILSFIYELQQKYIKKDL
jgi:GT2 family glycosyltransferase